MFRHRRAQNRVLLHPRLGLLEATASKEADVAIFVITPIDRRRKKRLRLCDLASCYFRGPFQTREVFEPARSFDSQLFILRIEMLRFPQYSPVMVFIFDQSTRRLLEIRRRKNGSSLIGSEVRFNKIEILIKCHAGITRRRGRKEQ